MTVRPTTQHDIQIDDENTTKQGFAVASKVLVTGSMYMNSTGADAGTGQVTIFISGSGVTGGDAHNHVGGDGAPLSIPQMLMAHGLLATIPASTTVYICPPSTTWTTAPTVLNTVVTIAGTLKNFYVRTGTTQPASGTLVCTVFVNNVATAIVITIAAGALSGNYSDLTHSVAIGVGDRLSFELKNNATAASAQISVCVVELDVANV